MADKVGANSREYLWHFIHSTTCSFQLLYLLKWFWYSLASQLEFASCWHWSFIETCFPSTLLFKFTMASYSATILSKLVILTTFTSTSLFLWHYPTKIVHKKVKFPSANWFSIGSLKKILRFSYSINLVLKRIW